MGDNYILALTISGIGLMSILMGVVKAVMDTLLFHYDTSVFKKAKNQDWWNPVLSWDNKNTMSSNLFIKWMLRSPLVFLTDAWHLFGFLYMFLLVSIVFVSMFVQHSNVEWYWWLLVSVSIWVVHSVSFHIFFTYIFVYKK